MKAMAMIGLLALGLAVVVTEGDAGRHGRHHWRDRIRGSGDLATEERDVKDFERLVIDCAFDVHIEIGKPSHLVLTHDDNLLDLIITEVRGSTLRLDCEGDHETDRSCRVEITTPTLEEITIHGAANVTIEDYEGDDLEYNLRGAGDLEIEGRVDRFEVNLSGAGDVDARDLIAARADVMVSGAGSVRVHAEESFRGNVSGVGSIHYYGDPEHVRRQVSGIGRIRHH